MTSLSTLKTFTVVALTALGLTACAHGYDNRLSDGAVIGGASGAVIGGVATHSVGGAVVGGVAGAIVGDAINGRHNRMSCHWSDRYQRRVCRDL